MFKLKKLTDCKWLNLFEVLYTRDNLGEIEARPKERSWILCSRKAHPITDAAKSDAVMIVAVVKTPHGNRLVVTREFRVPVWDYEYSFPAGLFDGEEGIEEAVSRELKEETGLDLAKIVHISPPVYSTTGMSDESNHMVLIEATGTASKQHLTPDEDIEVFLMDVQDIRDLLASKNKIAAKAWGILYHFAHSDTISI